MSEEQYRFLERTQKLFHRIENDLQSHDVFSDTLWEDLEENLLAADIGPATSRWFIQSLQQRVKEEEIRTGSQVFKIFRQELLHLLNYPSPLHFSQQSPVTVMVVMGERGSGKTTSIAKLAYRLTQEGHKVLIASADTSRSNDSVSLKAWDEQMNVSIIHQRDHSDAGIAVYDALQSALVHGYDVLLVDTTGHLTTPKNDMEGLRDIVRTMHNILRDAPHELLLVIDATHGQHSLPHVREIAESTGTTGFILSKVDDTAKGGCAFAVADDLGAPIKFLGTGEKVEDLVAFDPERFVAALFAED